MREIKDIYNILKKSKYPTGMGPSLGWENIVRHVLQKAIYGSSDEIEFIHKIQECAQFSIPHTNFEKFTLRLIDKYVEKIGRTRFHESPASSPNLTVEHMGMKYSTNFFWNMGTVQRLAEILPTKPDTVLEIGGGYGELARLNHLSGAKTVIILDLIESSICQYVYLKNSLPKARVLFKKDSSQISPEDFKSHDLIIVPLPFMDSLKISVDLAINISSFGEMTQEAVNGYWRFLEYDIKPKYFYSINRYGRHPLNFRRFARAVLQQFLAMKNNNVQYDGDHIKKFFFRHLRNVCKNPKVFFDFPPREFISEDACGDTLPIDPKKWDIVVDTWCDKNQHYQIDPNHPAFREVLLSQSF